MRPMKTLVSSIAIACAFYGVAASVAAAAECSGTIRVLAQPRDGLTLLEKYKDEFTKLSGGADFQIDYLNENERNALAMRDLSKVVEEIVDHPLPQMIYFWDALSPDEKVVLSLLATRLAEDGGFGWATAGDIVAE